MVASSTSRLWREEKIQMQYNNKTRLRTMNQSTYRVQKCFEILLKQLLRDKIPEIKTAFVKLVLLFNTLTSISEDMV